MYTLVFTPINYVPESILVTPSYFSIQRVIHALQYAAPANKEMSRPANHPLPGRPVVRVTNERPPVEERPWVELLFMSHVSDDP